ncbi:DUF2157 domain-containing protein [Endothiovibrio diazotrophicus]
MEIQTREEAQRRVDQIHAFRRELARLERDGVVALDPPQREALEAHHRQLLADYAAAFDVDRDEGARRLSLGMRIASLCGALALAASLFFLFQRFWGHFPEPLQVAILIGAALGTLGATAWIDRRDPSGYFTKLAALLAFTAFVLDLYLLGRIFNITPSDNALLVWGTLALLLAYAADLRLLLVAAILCLTAFIAARVGSWGGAYWIYFGERPENFLPAALALFAVPSLLDHRRFAGFAASYRVFALLIFFLPVLLLGNWGAGSYLEAEPALIEGGYQLLGFLGSAAMVWLGLRRGWPEVGNTASALFILFLYTKLFDWWWEIMPKYLFFLVLGLVALLLLLVMRRLRRRGARVAEGAP